MCSSVFKFGWILSVDCSRAVDYDRSLTRKIRKHPDWFDTEKPIAD
jgi:hypothetical protein